MSEESKALVRRLFEAVNARDVDALEEVVDEHVTYHGWEVNGREQLKEKTTGLLEAFPDLAITIDDLVAEGDRVAARISSTGTHRAPFEGIPATGRAIDAGETDFFRIENGRIAEVWQLYDALRVMQQLGMLPDGEPAEASSG